MDALKRVLAWVFGLFRMPPTTDTPEPFPQAPASSWLDLCEPFTKGWEGCRLVAYWDGIGKVWTIGYGATGPHITQGMVWTQAQADTDLRARLAVIGQEIDTTCPVKLNDNQKAALADFAYNEGIARLTGCDIYLHLKDGDPTAAMKELSAYDKARGAYVQGLENRRIAEARLFDT